MYMVSIESGANELAIHSAPIFITLPSRFPRDALDAHGVTSIKGPWAVEHSITLKHGLILSLQDHISPKNMTLKGWFMECSRLA